MNWLCEGRRLVRAVSRSEETKGMRKAGKEIVGRIAGQRRSLKAASCLHQHRFSPPNPLPKNREKYVGNQIEVIWSVPVAQILS